MVVVVFVLLEFLQLIYEQSSSTLHRKWGDFYKQSNFMLQMLFFTLAIYAEDVAAVLAWLLIFELILVLLWLFTRILINLIL